MENIVVLGTGFAGYQITGVVVARNNTIRGVTVRLVNLNNYSNNINKIIK